MIIAFFSLNVEVLQKFAFDGEAVSMNAWKCSGLDSRALRRKGMVDDDNDVHVNACCLTKQLQSLLWSKVGHDIKIIEYITESFRSCQLQQLHSLMINVDAESIARGDTHICLSVTEKAIAMSMNAWKCSGLDSWALRMMRMVENGQLIFSRIRWMMMMMIK